MILKVGDDVVVADGELKGLYGKVVGYENVFDLYLVEIPELALGHYFGFKLPDIERLDPFPEVPNEGEPVPPFGMSTTEFASYVENFIESTLSRVVEVGGPKHAKNGFQEFEGRPALEVITHILKKIEDVTVHAAMAHVLFRRIQIGLEGK